MKKRQFTALSFFFAFALFAVLRCDTISPEDDATPYFVNISLKQPTTTMVAKGQIMPIEVRFDRTPSGGFIHNVKIDIRNDKDSLIALIFEKKVHTYNNYTFSETFAFKPKAVGNFIIKVSSTNEMGQQPSMKDFPFSVNH